MRYFEWDRLRIQRESHAGDRVFKQSVRFELFKTYSSRVLWSAMLHKSMGLFYGNLISQRNLFIENMAKQSRRFEESALIDLYDFSEDLKDIGEQLENDYSSFNYHGYLDSFEMFLKDIVEFRNEIKEGMLNNGMIEANDRKLQFILVNSDGNIIEELKKPIVYSMVEDLLKNSSWERVFFVPLVSSSLSFPKELHELFEWSAYLGSENDEYLHDLHKDLEDSYYSKHQMVLGSAFMKNIDKLTILHPLKFTPSKFANEIEERFKTEDELYKEFLKSLDDGTEQFN